MKKYNTLVDVIKHKNSIGGDKGVTFITDENDETYVSYKDLYDKSLRYLHNLQNNGVNSGDKLIFQMEDNEGFVYIFWACILGGIIPVPLTVGSNKEHRLKLIRIWQELDYPCLITCKKTFNTLEKFMINNGHDSTLKEVKNKIVFVEDFKEEDTYVLETVHTPEPNDIAFIQYSSGSTANPKGVILTHENLISNITAITESGKLNLTESGISWMPLTHDMGIIGFHLVPVVNNKQHYIMPTSLFIRKPALWIKKASEHKVEVISSPNFGYQYFLSHFKPETAIDWDLSRIRIIYNGAEPISADLCSKFLNVLSKYGLKKNTMYPVYGMAEASLAVSCPLPEEDMKVVHLERDSLKIGSTVKETEGKNAKTVAFVDLGYIVNDCNVRICDEGNRITDERVIGNIQIKGKNVTNGYYNNKRDMERLITSDGWLKTGDLGFMRENRLIVTGRAKDIIFINGQNYYPHDIEQVCGEVEGIEPSSVGACGVFDEDTQIDQIILFVKHRGNIENFADTVIELKKYVNRQIGQNVKEVVPVMNIPKTTSGKTMRYKLIEDYKSKVFEKSLNELNTLINEKNSKNNSRRSTDKKQQKIEDGKEKKTAFLFPGQGSQYVGMGKNFYENFEVARSTFEEAGDVLGFDVKELCFNSSIERLTKTHNTQPALLTTSVAAFRVYMQEIGVKPQFLAGHSLGEFSALVCGGAIEFADALKIVRRRGELMQETSKQGGMIAVSKIDKDILDEECRNISKEDGIAVVSCYNSPSQNVISGHENVLKQLGNRLEGIGAKVVHLKVSNAFHSILMENAAEKLQIELAKYKYNEPDCPIISNVTAMPYANSDEFVRGLVLQMTKPVKWHQSMEFLMGQGIELVVELGPKTVLKNLMREISPKINAVSFDRKKDIQEVLKLITDSKNQTDKEIPDFNVVSRCLAVAICTKNSNWNNEEYQTGVIEPYRKIKGIQSLLDKEARKPTANETKQALDMLKSVFITKQVSKEEQEKRFNQIFEETMIDHTILNYNGGHR